MTTKKSNKILIVEDEQALNDAYKMILESSDYDVRVAFDGQEALDVLNHFDPDLILLDLKMPNVDGLEFLNAYNERKPSNRAKVILFSNFDLQEEIEEAYRLGIDKYLLKAWASPRDLLKIIRESIG
jgi:CheY-like chemotaxis protein